MVSSTAGSGDSRRRAAAGTLLKVTLAWVPFGVLWTLFLVIYSEFQLTEALLASLRSMGAAALLGLGVWWFSGRYPWPDRLKLSFYFTHLLLGITYAATWLLAAYTYDSIYHGREIITLIRESPVFGWQLIMGLWLYGLVAGVSYAVRIRRRLREQERVAAHAEALAVKAQLQTLQAQLNPHFLFNALHSLSTLITDEPRTAERAVERLGELLRYVLDEEGDDLVPLADEWEFTKHYLDLERLRLNSRLKVETRFEPGTLSCLVPPFTLQPLVENAVKYAVASRPEGGRIEIETNIDEGTLAICVRDDGPGADLADQSVEGGLGLGILRQRLQALYEDSSLLSIESQPGAGFAARVFVPQRET
jgi:signal transduction histidine kinase